MAHKEPTRYLVPWQISALRAGAVGLQGMGTGTVVRPCTGKLALSFHPEIFLQVSLYPLLSAGLCGCSQLEVLTSVTSVFVTACTVGIKLSVSLCGYPERTVQKQP